MVLFGFRFVTTTLDAAARGASDLLVAVSALQLATERSEAGMKRSRELRATIATLNTAQTATSSEINALMGTLCDLLLLLLLTEFGCCSLWRCCFCVGAGSRRRVTEVTRCVTVIFDASAAGAVTLSLSYLVSNASWSPSYGESAAVSICLMYLVLDRIRLRHNRHPHQLPGQLSVLDVLRCHQANDG